MVESYFNTFRTYRGLPEEFAKIKCLRYHEHHEEYYFFFSQSYKANKYAHTTIQNIQRTDHKFMLVVFFTVFFFSFFPLFYFFIQLNYTGNPLMKEFYFLGHTYDFGLSS